MAINNCGRDSNKLWKLLAKHKQEEKGLDGHHHELYFSLMCNFIGWQGKAQFDMNSIADTWINDTAIFDST
jgi:hypothetical protein